MPVDPVLLELLACPTDQGALRETEGGLTCEHGHTFPLLDGIPVFLTTAGDNPIVSNAQARLTTRKLITPDSTVAGAVDPYVQDCIVHTNGNLYRHLVGKLPRYPIPEIPVPEGHGEFLLDLGCNWGRWSIAAARKGYVPVGIDPKPEAVLAARRIMAQLGHRAHFVIGDGRALPFRRAAFGVVFSNGVLQHFSKPSAHQALDEMTRTLAPGGRAVVQLAGKYGLRTTLVRVARGFQEAQGFDVRHWRPREIREALERRLGSSKLTADAYLSLNAQRTDADLLTWSGRRIVGLSSALVGLSRAAPWLVPMADSLYVEATKSAGASG